MIKNCGYCAKRKLPKTFSMWMRPNGDNIPYPVCHSCTNILIKTTTDEERTKFAERCELNLIAELQNDN